MAPALGLEWCIMHHSSQIQLGRQVLAGGLDGPVKIDR